MREMTKTGACHDWSNPNLTPPHPELVAAMEAMEDARATYEPTDGRISHAVWHLSAMIVKHPRRDLTEMAFFAGRPVAPRTRNAMEVDL